MFDAFRKYISQLISLDDEEWLKILACVKVKQLKKHDRLLEPHEVCRHIAFVNRGAIRTFYNRDGEEITFFFFFENDVACDYESFILQRATGFALEAIEDTEVILLSHEDTQRFYNQLREGQKLARYIAEYLFISQRQRTFALLLQTPEERYQQLIDEKSTILQRVNQYYIATYLGIKPQSLSRIRKRMSADV